MTQLSRNLNFVAIPITSERKKETHPGNCYHNNLLIPPPPQKKKTLCRELLSQLTKNNFINLSSPTYWVWATCNLALKKKQTNKQIRAGNSFHKNLPKNNFMNLNWLKLYTHRDWAAYNLACPTNKATCTGNSKHNNLPKLLKNQIL